MARNLPSDATDIGYGAAPRGRTPEDTAQEDFHGKAMMGAHYPAAPVHRWPAAERAAYEAELARLKAERKAALEEIARTQAAAETGIVAQCKQQIRWHRAEIDRLSDLIARRGGTPPL